MAPKLPYKAAQVVTQKFSQKVPAGEASDAAKMLAKYWEPAGDEVSRAVAADAYSGYGLDVSPPVDPAVAFKWSQQSGPPLDETDLSKLPVPGQAQPGLPSYFSNWTPAQDTALANTTKAARENRAARDARLGDEDPWNPRVIGAAATIGAGALALGAGSANAQGFTEEELADIDKLSDAEFGKFVKALSPEERVELDRAMAAPKPQPVKPGKPVDYSQYMTPQATPQIPAPQPGVNFSPSQSGLEGASLAEEINANLGAVPDDFNPVNAFKAAYGIAQPLLREGIKEPLTPLVTQAQSALRGVAQSQAEAVGMGKPSGTPAETLAQNAMSLFIGSPNQYQTTQEMEQRATEVADSPLAAGLGKTAIAVGGGVPGAIAAPFVDDVSAAGLAYEGTKEAAYLPLYLIDARSGAGAVERAAIGGGLSEALDPRPGSDIARGTVFAGALGAGFQAAGAVGAEVLKAARAAKWVTSQNLAGEVVSRAGNAMELAVTPVREFSVIADAASTGAPKGGAKASVFVVKPGDDGVLVAEKIVIAKDGQKLSAVVPLEQTPLQKAFNEALAKESLNRSGDVKEALKTNPGRTQARMKKGPPVLVDSSDLSKLPEEVRSQVTVFNRFDKSLPEVGTPETMARGLAEATPLKDPTAAPQSFEIDSEHLPLDRLPDDDVMLSWPTAGGNREFRVLSKREMQLMSLKNRPSLVLGINTPEGVKYVETSPVAKDVKPKFEGLEGMQETIKPGEVYVQPFDPAEKVPTVETGMIVKKSDVFDLNDGDLNKLLDARDALLSAEREAALHVADAQAAQELGASGVTTVETPAGPKVALSSLDAPPMDTNPAPAPPGAPPDGPGGGFSGVPPPPMPPNPGMLDRNIPDRVGWLQNALSPTFLPPTVTGPLDATAAATMIASSRNTDALRSRVDEASRRVMRPVLANLTPQQIRNIDASTVEFIEGRKSLNDLLAEHPVLAGEAEQHWEATRARSQQIQAVLEERGMVHPLAITEPGGGKETLDFVREVKRSRAYLMQPYYAHTLESGAWAKYVKRNEKEYNTLVDRYVNEVVKPKQTAGNNPLDRDAMKAIAERELDAVLRDPDALAEKFNVEIRRGSKKSDGTNALKPKAGQGLEEALVIMGKRAESWTAAQKDAAYRFVAGSADEKELGRAFAGGPAGTEKDIQFLRETRERADSSLPGWLKMALGPIESPITRASFTAEAQEELLMRSEALETLVKAGAVLPQDVLAISRPSALNGGETERWIKIPDNKRLYGNHAGKYVHPAYGGFLYYDEARDGMQNLVTRVLAPIARKWKVAQTVLSQGSWLVNVMGNLNGMAMSGTMPLHDILNPKGAPASFVDSISQWRDFTHAPNKLSTPEQRSGADWIRDSIKYGVMSSDFVSAEFKQVLDKWARMSFPGERAPATTVDYLLAMADAVKGVSTKALKTYGAIDPFFKHVNWLNGVRRGGVDIKTGQLADREAAVRFLKGWGGDEVILRSLSDADLAERVKAGNARVIAESHPQPDRMGRAQESIAKVGDVTGPLGAVNQFYRTSSEVLRTHMMLPYRMMARPGVATSVMEYAMLAAAMGAGMTALKRRMGIDPEEERKSFMALPPALRKFKPGAFALPVPKDDAGRVTYVDLGRMFDALKFFNGEVGGRQVLEGLSETPGQVMANVAYNMASTGLGFGNTTDAVVRDFLEDSGLLAPVVDKQAVQPGAAAALDRIWKYAAPGFARTGWKAVMQSTPSQLNPNPVSPLRSGVEMLTGGVVFQGGSDRDAAKQNRGLMKQEQKLMRPNLMREGTPLGPFQRFDRQKAADQRREQIQQIRSIRR